MSVSVIKGKDFKLLNNFFFLLIVVVVVVVTQVTYDPKVQARTVTLGGDLFDPQGTATGGK